jgi:hypothetical protein
MTDGRWVRQPGRWSKFNISLVFLQLVVNFHVFFSFLLFLLVNVTSCMKMLLVTVKPMLSVEA